MPATPYNGLLLLNKKSGITSFEALNEVKKIFATKKVGHTGTLDKFASGLLLALIGRGVKLACLFENCVKEYTGTIAFGEETDTLDPYGIVSARGEVPSREAVEAVLDGFRGEILQAPPAYSAVHVNGRRAYELALEGKEPEMKKRPVTVYELSIISWTPPEAEIRAIVSAGTYIRSLARDIALAVGSRAHLSSLTRTKVGPFSLANAANKKTKDNENGNNIEKIREALLPLDVNLFKNLSIPFFLIDKIAEEKFIHGRPLETLLPAESVLPGNKTSVFPEGVYAGVFRKSDPGVLLGAVKRKNSGWTYVSVFPGNDHGIKDN